MYLQDAQNENKEIIRKYRELLSAWGTGHTEEDQQTIKKAFNLAAEAHKDMRRKSGEPYIFHPIEVARIVALEIGLGTTSIVSALLHDVVEDTDYTLNDIKTQFGDTVSKIIDGLTKIEEIFDNTSSTIQAENFKKILLTLSDDIRVILIKLADRLHNMRTLGAMPKEKQLKIASETLFLYAPLALRLGLYSVKEELEDLSLKYTESDIYETISEKIQQSGKQREKLIDSFIEPVKKDLKKNNIDFRLDTEVRSVYSVWEKMKTEEIPFEEVYNSFFVRIVIDSKLNNEKVDCWRVYTILTDYYRPNVEKLRDWISIPKANGYEALHTTVMSNSGKWIDVHILSERMYEIAVKGYVALFRDKEGSDGSGGLNEWMAKIREILNTENQNTLDFISDFKMNLFSDEIFVFTPRGEMKSLPNESTVLDFAYNIHSQIGDECIGAKVNHKLVPLNHSLKSGDQVEILTSKRQIPREDWFGFVKTARAKHRIKTALRDYKKQYKEKGKEILKGIFKQLNLEFNGSNLQRILQKYNIKGSIDLYYSIAQNNIGIKEIRSCFTETERGWFKYLRRPFSKGQKSLSDTVRDAVRNNPESVLIGGDISAVKYEISACCNPIPGDDVVGFIDEENPIQIHQTNCPRAINLMSTQAGRIVKAKWKMKETISFLAGLKITGIDHIGFINTLTNVISKDFNLNIRSFHLESTEGVSQGVILVYVPDSSTLSRLVDRLKKIKEIEKVSRIKRLDDPGL